MPYETLINPPSVESNTLHWPWRTVKENLDKLEALGKDYVGRRLYLLFNPLTDRFNGTTPNFFATITIRPPGIVDKPHRHVSSAINYYFNGSGYSRVEGKRYDWKAGDLMVSAPGWAVHNHASNDGDPVYELTIQDQPLNIYMESLLWQEDLAEPAKILGSHEGFATNRAALSAAMFYDPRENLRPAPLTHNPINALVAPRPIGWIGSLSAAGEENLAPFSYFNVFSADPPVVAFAPNAKQSDGGPKDTLANVRAVPEFTASIVSEPLAQQMNETSRVLDHGVSEFAAAGLTAAPSTNVRPPHVGEALAVLECVVFDIVALPADKARAAAIWYRRGHRHPHRRCADRRGQAEHASACSRLHDWAPSTTPWFASCSRFHGPMTL